MVLVFNVPFNNISVISWIIMIEIINFRGTKYNGNFIE